MYLGRPATTNEARALIGMVQCYRDMWLRQSLILSPQTQAASGPKGKKVLGNGTLESSFKEIKRMVFAETQLSYLDFTVPFTLQTNASDKQLGAVISQNNKPIEFFSGIMRNPHRNYTTTDKELIKIVECLKQFRGILFGYKINVFSDHKNLVYVETLSEPQRVMLPRLILRQFGTNIQHISGVHNIVSNNISRLLSMPIDK